jgi:hypothetical protein
MNISEEWDKKEKSNLGFNVSGVQVDLTIGGFTSRPEEYVIVMRNKEKKPFNMTIELPDAPRSIDGRFYRHGIYMCPACDNPYDDNTISMLEKLTPYTETEIICNLCEADHAYFKKDLEKDFSEKLGLLTDFLNRRLVQVQPSEIQPTKKQLPPEYIIISSYKGKPYDITVESPEPSKTHGGISHYRYGIERCPSCACQHEATTVKLLENLIPNTEKSVSCRFCEADSIYFRKEEPVKIRKIINFIDRKFIQPSKI